MIKAFYIEIKKLKNRKLFLLLFGFLAMLFSWASMTAKANDAYFIANGYYSELYQLPIMNTILLPVFIAVIASRIWDTEHKGNTFKLLYTLQQRSSIYFAKSILGILFMLLISIGEFIIILLISNIHGFTQPFPVKHTVMFFITTFLTSALLYFIQEILSCLFENQMIALSVGLIGSFLGLFGCFFARSAQQYIIWSYYSVLQTIGMNWDEVTREISYFEAPLSVPHIIILCTLLVILIPIGNLLFAKREV